MKLLKSKKGSVAVEMALFSPFMFLLTFTIFEVGTACYYKQLLVNASREGARYGSIESDITSTDVENYVMDVLERNGFNKAASIEISGVNESRGSLVSVRISYAYQFSVLKSFISSLSNITLSSSTVMRHE